jgi:hypothetical protein
MIQIQKNQDGTRTSEVFDQMQKISSLESLTNQKRDVIGGVQPMFVYQSTSLNYYELVEDSEVEENTNINVVEETKENYL